MQPLQPTASSRFLYANDLEQSKYYKIKQKFLSEKGVDLNHGCFTVTEIKSQDLVFDDNRKEDGGQNHWFRHRYEKSTNGGIYEILEQAGFSQIVNSQDRNITEINNQIVSGWKRETGKSRKQTLSIPRYTSQRVQKKFSGELWPHCSIFRLLHA